MKRLILSLLLLPFLAAAVGCDDKKTSPPSSSGTGSPQGSGLPAPPPVPPKP